jgi:hypothetical protein
VNVVENSFHVEKPWEGTSIVIEFHDWSPRLTVNICVVAPPAFIS